MSTSETIIFKNGTKKIYYYNLSDEQIKFVYKCFFEKLPLVIELKRLYKINSSKMKTNERITYCQSITYHSKELEKIQRKLRYNLRKTEPAKRRVCECGTEVRSDVYARHLKTKSHIQIIQNRLK